jgi:small subunit ribosomal protein S17
MDEKNEVVANTVAVARSVTGTVVSNKMDKTITLRVERRVKHPVYGKFVRKSKKIHAHDAKNLCSIGDVVTVEECRPISKTKSWMLKRVEVKASEV